MEVNSCSYTVNIPAGDAALLKSLAKKFGWVARKCPEKKRSHLDEAIEAAHNGILQEATTIDELMNGLKK